MESKSPPFKQQAKMSKITISLPAPKPEMGVRGVTGCVIYSYDSSGKQITQEEYTRQTLAGIAAALASPKRGGMLKAQSADELGADKVIFKPESSAARRRDVAAAAGQQVAGAKDGAQAAAAQTPKEERKKTDSVPQHGLAEYLDAAFVGGGKKKAGKKEKKVAGGERFSLEDITGK